MSAGPGRFGINLITGWQKAEYDQMGLWPGESHYSDRYNYLAEYATVLRALMETGVSDFKGKYLEMHDCRVSPHPQDVKIICAGSSDEGLAFTAQYADYSFALGKGTNWQDEILRTMEVLDAAFTKPFGYGLLRVPPAVMPPSVEPMNGVVASNPAPPNAPAP